jgi:hypothetical protein
VLDHDPVLGRVLSRWLGGGIEGAALVDRSGETVACVGTISEDEAMPLAALVLYRGDQLALTERLFAGEVMTVEAEQRDLAIAVARRQLFVVVSLAPTASPVLGRIGSLRDDVASYLGDATPDVRMPPWGLGGAPAPAQASLSLFGHRERAKA